MIGALRLLAAAWPRAGVAAAHAFAALTLPLGHGIADADIAAVFPELGPEARRPVRQLTWEAFLKGEAVDAAVRRRTGYPRVIPSPELTSLRPPLVLASFHVGPHQALAEVLRALPGEVVAIDRGQFARRGGLRLLPAGEDQWARARTFHRTVTALRSGASVFVDLDAFHPDDYDVATIEAPVLGRSLPLARGAFALARIGRVPLVPLVARWRGTAIETTVGEAIDPSAGEQAMAAAAGRFLDEYLRERPGEVSVFVLERLRPPPVT